MSRRQSSRETESINTMALIYAQVGIILDKVNNTIKYDTKLAC